MASAWDRELWGVAAVSAALLLLVLSRTDRGAVVAVDTVDAVMGALTPRGIRNNNPGNLRPGSQWRGLADPPSDGQYLRFVSPEFGLRALALLVRNYQRNQRLFTVRAMISRWAPPDGRDANGRPYSQDTESYIAAVARRLGVSPDARVNASDPATLEKLTRAIVAHENGARWERHYTPAQYAGAVREALAA